MDKIRDLLDGKIWINLECKFRTRPVMKYSMRKHNSVRHSVIVTLFFMDFICV